jgi:LmbE family N-acetylglucosaminyl deacetylase
MRSVLAVGAHPDDIEIGCAGALAAHRAAGDSVTMLVLTGGQGGPGITGDRRAEAEAAARTLDCLLVWGRLIDCSVQPDPATIAAIENVINSVEADVVYVHAPDDSHQDHRAAATATLSAARHSSRVLHYAGRSTVRFQPTVFVDISAYLDRKLAALHGHRSQVDGSPMVESEVVAASARHLGAQARVRYAEAFAPARFIWDLLPVPHLPAQHRCVPESSVERMSALPARAPAW